MRVEYLGSKMGTKKRPMFSVNYFFLFPCTVLIILNIVHILYAQNIFIKLENTIFEVSKAVLPDGGL
jgi:hypothetical protein